MERATILTVLPFEAADYVQQLADTILQEYGKLPDRRVIPPSDRRQSGTGTFVVAHGWPLPLKKCPVYQQLFTDPNYRGSA